MKGRIFVAKAVRDNFTRVCASTQFYSKQLEWSIATVCRYWEQTLANPLNVPLEVEETAAFCLSWIIGTDCTSWSPFKLHIWFRAKLGCEPLFFHEHLKRISVRRRSDPEAMCVLYAPPPVYGGYRVARPYTHDPRFSDSEYDAIDALSFLPYACMTRQYSPPTRIP